MKKVLFLLHYPPPIHGASIVGKYIIESQLINQDFFIKYLNLSTAKSLNNIGKNTPVKLFRYISLVLNTIFYILKDKPQLVYMTLTTKGKGLYKDAFVALIIKTFGCKIVYHLHNKGVKTRQDRRFDNFLYKVVFKNTKVILLSHKLCKDIQKYVTADSRYICPNGVPKIKIEKYKDSLGSKKSVIQILFLSNLMEAKGIYVLLEACKILEDRNIKFGLKIIGAESDVSLFKLREKIKKLKIKNDVHYLGPKYNNEKNSYFALSDIFVFPSLDECFPLVLLEAMQFNLPVVTTREGGIPDIIKNGENGFLVEKRDATDLANKLEILIKDKRLRKRMGDDGRERYLNNYTIDHFEKQFVKILNTIIHR